MAVLITFVMPFKYYWMICKWPNGILPAFYLLSFWKSMIKSECYKIDSDNSLNVMKVQERDLGLFFRYSPLGQLCNHEAHAWLLLISLASHSVCSLHETCTTSIFIPTTRLCIICFLCLEHSFLSSLPHKLLIFGV